MRKLKMNKTKIFITLIFLNLTLSSCGAVKEGFSSAKSKSSDEFLVKKKTPLVMPPNFDELPVPKLEENQTEKEEGIKSLITSNENIKNPKSTDNSNKNLVNSILSKINKN